MINHHKKGTGNILQEIKLSRLTEVANNAYFLLSDMTEEFGFSKLQILFPACIYLTCEPFELPFESPII